MFGMRNRHVSGKSKKELIVDLHCRAATAVIGDCVGGVRRLRPAEYPVGFVGTHVDAAMTHLRAKIFMPVGAMKCVTNRSEEGCPGYSGKHVSAFICGYIASFTNAEVAISHVFGWDFIHNVEFAVRRCCGYPIRAAHSRHRECRKKYWSGKLIFHIRRQSVFAL